MEFTSNRHQRARRFYRYLNDVGEYLEGMADDERQTEIHSATDLI